METPDSSSGGSMVVPGSSSRGSSMETPGDSISAGAEASNTSSRPDSNSINMRGLVGLATPDEGGNRWNLLRYQENRLGKCTSANGVVSSGIRPRLAERRTLLRGHAVLVEHTATCSSLYRITELLSRIKYGNRGLFYCMTFTVIDQLFV